MTNPYYNPKLFSANTVVRAAAVNSELNKLQAAFAKLPDPTAIGTGGGTPNYTHYAYADSADGTANFTTGTSNNRAYVGVAVNQPTATKSEQPEDYEWSRLKGIDGEDGETPEDGEPGANGTNGSYTEQRYIRSLAPPAQANGNSPAGTSLTPPAGDDPLWITFAIRSGLGTLTTPWSVWERISAYPAPKQYDPAFTYYAGMQALFGGGTYVLIVDNSLGNAPSGTAQPNSFWDVVAAPGEAGEPATAPAAFTDTINLTSSTNGANLRSLADAAGYTGKSDATITFNVPNGVEVSGTNTGGIGIDTGTWPSGYTITLDLVVQSGGTVYGGGGCGGSGGSGSNGMSGKAGGDAVYQRVDLNDLTIDSGGVLRGGGGGGGGGAGSFSTGSGEPFGSAGGGGGGGAPNGMGGAGGTTFNTDIQAASGANGTSSGGGAGGAGANDGSQTGNTGGNGGDFAAAGTSVTGAAGGAAGYAVRRNGFASPLTNNGSLSGTVG